MRAKRVTAAILSLLSIGVSVAILTIGIEMWTESGAPISIQGFGGVSIGYAVLSIGILFMAWRRGSRVLERTAAIAAVGFLVAMTASAALDGELERMEQSS
ncbi:MAG: hypothetical protein ACREXT_02085, partial [Gammaproteobacteria bacterium]